MKHWTLSALLGVFISFMVYAILYPIYLILSFDLAGGETLQEFEGHQIILSIVTVSISGMILLRFDGKLKKIAKKYVFIGILILPLSMVYLNHFAYKTTFEKNIWQKSNPKPLNMATTLMKDDILIGMTIEEVREILGQGIEYNLKKSATRGYMSYKVASGWIMTIFFSKNKVIEITLRQPMMMTQRINDKSKLLSLFRKT